MSRKLKFVVAVSVCLLALNLMALGQSGRKQKKNDEQPPVQGVNQPDKRVQPEPELIPEKPKENERRTIMIMSSLPDAMIPVFYADTARQACLSEMSRALKSIDLREASNQNRADAVKIAKEDERTYVVLIEIEADRMGSSTNGIDLRYSVFEPKTGKMISSGSGYPTQSGIGTPLPPVGGSREQVYVELAGRDIARQVMKKLGLIT